MTYLPSNHPNLTVKILSWDWYFSCSTDTCIWHIASAEPDISCMQINFRSSGHSCSADLNSAVLSSAKSCIECVLALSCGQWTLVHPSPAEVAPWNWQGCFTCFSCSANTRSSDTLTSAEPVISWSPPATSGAAAHWAKWTPLEVYSTWSEHLPEGLTCSRHGVYFARIQVI